MKAAVYFFTVAQLFVALTQCVAQDQAPKLDLVSARVRSGAPVFVNAMLSHPSEERILVIREKIQFPNEKLVFVAARMGLAGDLVGAVLSVELKDKSGAKVKDKAAAESIEVSITAKEPLQEGPLVEFEFRLAESKDQTIQLGHQAEALDDTGKKLAGLVFSDAEVVVSEDISSEPRPAIGCFFFTH